MAGAGDEWELCKENVQPLKQGRSISTLQNALTQQDGLSHATIQQQKQAFEAEIRFYTGDDQLDVWDRYIKWTEQAYPQGGKESNLSAVLERAVERFSKEQKYNSDPRYLDLWLKFAGFCSEPLDVYNYLHGQGIGISLAALYIAWAEEYEVRGNNKKADAILQEGLLHKAEPLDRLQSHHRHFQARVTRQVFSGLSNESEEQDWSPEDVEPQRSSLAELKSRGKKAVVPVCRVGSAVQAHSQQSSQQMGPLPMQQRQQGFVVFNDSRAKTNEELYRRMTQPRPAMPAASAKENELNPGPWNTARVHQDPRTTPAASFDKLSFTPYVDESVQPQTMTPCKIEPSVNNVLSTRKPGKEEDPLERVQVHCQEEQEKKEQVMYCKDMLYAGVEEFCFEEIRAEVHRKRQFEQHEAELKAMAEKKVALRQQIEEMEKLIWETRSSMQTIQLPSPGPAQQKPAEEPEGPTAASEIPKGIQGVPYEGEVALATASSVETLQTASSNQENLPEELFPPQQQQQCAFVEPSLTGESMPGFVPPLPAVLSFAVFDESALADNQKDRPPVIQHNSSTRCPLAGVLGQSLTVHPEETVAETHKLHGIELLNEDPIVTSSYRDTTLCPNPEDTCDFVRAAQLASTPFHGGTGQREELSTDPEGILNEAIPDSARQALRLTDASKESHNNEPLEKNKLSPILEASREDARSSVSSASSISSVVGVASIRELQMMKFELGPSILAGLATDTLAAVNEVGEGVVEDPWSWQLRKDLVSTLPQPLSSSPEFYRMEGPVPEVGVEREIFLGKETYSIKREVLVGEDYTVYFGIPSHSLRAPANGVLLKVNVHPVPWDFYISTRLQERLGSDFQLSFSEKCSCYLYEDGCITLQRQRNCITLQDVMQQSFDSEQELVMILTLHLLDLVKRLHQAQIVHGDIRPETLLLQESILSSQSTGSLKIASFAHSLDMKLQTGVLSLDGFPILSELKGHEILADCCTPYQLV
ncbi:mitotic checkpoint serine/threonine-protein kinase BUB1 beta [Latimeria chalumnae]|uniref:mitotic checkpoint serine/threonine-protein kinase BUB1 beta n=1 Tax=Latimeria chalumnae TaxID=7897 RepID=UPI00313AA003